MVEFCTEENHNKEAPTLQNQKCNLRSTWEVISDSEDFKKTTPMTTQPPAPSFSLLQIGQRIVCLVLDKSGSMSVCSIALVFWKLAKDMCAVWSGPQFVLGINTDPRHCHQNRPSSCVHQRVSTTDSFAKLVCSYEQRSDEWHEFDFVYASLTNFGARGTHRTYLEPLQKHWIWMTV